MGQRRWLASAMIALLFAAGVWGGLQLSSGVPLPANAPAPEKPSAGNAPTTSQSETEPNPSESKRAPEESLAADVAFLAADEREGRGPGTDGLDEAAEYLAERFRRLDLKTDWMAGDVFQPFSETRGELTLGDDNALELASSDGQRRALTTGVDYTPLGLGAARGTLDNLPLVFAGYGIRDPRHAYDDYEDLDVEGKAVVVLRHAPSFLGSRDSSEPYRPGYMTSKIAAAAEQGARAVLFVTDHAALQNDSPTVPAQGEGKTALADTLIPLDLGGRAHAHPLAVFHVRREVIDTLLRSAGKADLQELEREIAQGRMPLSFDMDTHLSTRFSMTRETRQQRNVLASLEGQGSRRHETIILGAHYDHLGRGGWGSLAPWTADVHNGADDNASGTAVMLEVARRLAARSKPLPRRVLFIGFAAEEQGLVGSAHYVRRPAVPLGHTVAMVNLDMVGRLRGRRLTVYGTGTSSTFPSLLTQLADRHDFTLRQNRSGYGPSDHASFHARGIPVLHLFTGLHSNYHRPSDDADTLNYEGMEDIAAFVTELVVALAEDETDPARQSQPGALASLLSLRDAAPARFKQPTQPPAAYLGVVPNRQPLEIEKAPGVPVHYAVTDGPAHLAGIRAGDRVLRLDEHDVGTTERLQEALSEKHPGDVVIVLVSRDGLELELSVVLGERRRSR